jgi:hypothetical protein
MSWLVLAISTRLLATFKKVARACSETRSSDRRTMRMGEPDARNNKHFNGQASREAALRVSVAAASAAASAASCFCGMVTMPRVLMNSSMWVESSTTTSSAAAAVARGRKARRDKSECDEVINRCIKGIRIGVIGDIGVIIAVMALYSTYLMVLRVIAWRFS